MTSFILRWVFGGGVILALILSIKALYGWYLFAKSAVKASRRIIPAVKATRGQLHAIRLYGLVFPVIVLSIIGTVIWIWGIATLVHKQITAGGVYSSAPYGFFALFIGIAGISILWGVAVSAIDGSGRLINMRASLSIAPIMTILGVIAAVVVSNVAAKPSSSGAAVTLQLKCDPDATGSDCASVGPNTVIALDFMGANVYTLCNMGYWLYFTDNHGRLLDTTAGDGCLNTDSFILGGSDPYIKLGLPPRSKAGKLLCGRWVITLRVKDSSGTLVSTARYRTTVRC